MHICDAIHFRARQTPHRRAIVEGDRVTSYAELSSRIRRVAGTLRHMGVDTGDPVAVNLREGTNHIVAKFGILQAGAAALTLDWRNKADSVRILDRIGGDALVLTDPGRSLDGRHRVVEYDEAWGHAVNGQPANTDRAGGGDGPAFVTLSSGSTGEPKAVVFSHREHHWRYLQKNIFLPHAESDI